MFYFIDYIFDGEPEYEQYIKSIYFDDYSSYLFCLYVFQNYLKKGITLYDYGLCSDYK